MHCNHVYNITCTHNYTINGDSVLEYIYIRNTSLLRRKIKNRPPAKDIKDKTSTDPPLKGSERTIQRFSTKNIQMVCFMPKNRLNHIQILI